VAGRGLRDFLALQRRPSKGAGGADRHAGATAGGRGEPHSRQAARHEHSRGARWLRADP
ncbi:unnamed protein product, partial [Effrenium voratum]